MYPPENGGYMPNTERKKGKHLTLEDRQEIQRGLREHRSFKEIADIIGCSPDTVSKEIRIHRYHKVREKLKGSYAYEASRSYSCKRLSGGLVSYAPKSIHFL